ncbi:MAG: signal peptidase II [bacterium]
MKKNSRVAIIIAFLIFLFCLDLFISRLPWAIIVIPPSFQKTEKFLNRGAPMWNNLPDWFLLIANAFYLAFLIFLGIRLLKANARTRTILGIGLQVCGITANFADRIFLRFVPDTLAVILYGRNLYFRPSDIYLVLGLILLFFDGEKVIKTLFYRSMGNEKRIG